MSVGELHVVAGSVVGRREFRFCYMFLIVR